jgi:hypothetical protein
LNRQEAKLNRQDAVHPQDAGHPDAFAKKNKKN